MNLPPAITPSDNLVVQRRRQQGGVILYRSHRNLVARLLDVPIEEVDQEMRLRWIRSHKGIRFRE